MESTVCAVNLWANLVLCKCQPIFYFRGGKANAGGYLTLESLGLWHARGEAMIAAA